MWAKLKKIFTKPRLILLGKIAVFFVGALLCSVFIIQFYFAFGAGGIFGVVVIIWHARSIRELLTWRCPAFLFASMLGGAAVYWGWILSIDLFGMDINEFYFSVLTGTVLLSVAHCLFLGISLKRAVVAILSTYGIWFVYFTLDFGLHSRVSCIDWSRFFGWRNPLINQVTIWQAAYMLSMFGFRKKEPQLEAAE